MQTLISPETRARFAQKFHSHSKQGLIKMIIIIVIGIILISVLGFDIRAAVEHPQTQTNFSYLWELITDVWNTYLASIWAVIWNIIGPVIDTFWNNAQNFNWNDYNQGINDFVTDTPQIDFGN